ncbi:hypothetical protein E1B28_012045 [Marasmius oreades]|uniref:Uncharacterized protein n=1 Tax=Marasmius oreades TaxID=181124 RepID=A0A9P7UPI3_9AGAR|nr:uncharacterized protein E1B28_012045 [Marasmius oreades]KAG7088006.1 hypothetical protein E1B28_012045 [Marasmius oreades]
MEGTGEEWSSHPFHGRYSRVRDEVAYGETLEPLLSSSISPASSLALHVLSTSITLWAFQASLILVPSYLHSLTAISLAIRTRMYDQVGLAAPSSCCPPVTVDSSELLNVAIGCWGLLGSDPCIRLEQDPKSSVPDLVMANANKCLLQKSRHRQHLHTTWDHRDFVYSTEKHSSKRHGLSVPVVTTRTFHKAGVA